MEKVVENARVQKKPTAGIPSAQALWDPFWFMREMFNWGRFPGVPSFDVQETHDAFVYKVKLTLPQQADVARVRAKIQDGELTLVLPKAASAPRERASAGRKPRRRARSPARRG